jgi:uncharacterized membrane protein YkvA (DUF1232 family)
MGRMSAFAALWQALRGQRGPDAPPLGEQLRALPRLVSMTLRGQYPGMDRGRLLMMAMALVYVVSPVDVMPEALLLLAGFGDDALVLGWLAGAVLTETEAFLAWEAEGAGVRGGADPGRRGRTIPGEVV